MTEKHDISVNNINYYIYNLIKINKPRIIWGNYENKPTYV